MDNRNILDKYKFIDHSEILNDLRAHKHNISVLIQYVEGDFNIGTIIRNCNAFNVDSVYYHGSRRWDRRGSVGTHHYVNMKHLSSIDEIVQLKQKHTFVGLDNNISRPIKKMPNFTWPTNTLLVLGEEQNGIIPEVLALCDHFVEIPQYGSVRSLNVGTASGIALYDYVSNLER